MTPRTRHAAKWVALVAAFGALFAPTLARAQVSLGATVTQVGSLYHYSYTVTNPATATFDLAIVSIQGAAGASLTNLSAPTGFFTSYDPGNGLISFAPTSDADMGAFSVDSTVAPFSFDSDLASASASYEALDIQGNSFTGSTLAPRASAAVPEPGSLLLLAAGGLAFAAVGVRGRRRVTCRA